MKYQAPRGTEDAIPGESEYWIWLEGVFRECCRKFGYQDIRTPTFEETDLFVRGLGEGTDTVSKEMYTFLDKGGRSITLKPEGTASVVRAYLENSLGGQGSICKLAYITPVFRYERPQKGRLREHHQVGIESIGASTPDADAEVIEFTVRWYQALGMEPVSVVLNSLGMEECRLRYREALLEFAASFLADFATDFQERCKNNPLRLLDSKDEKISGAMADAPKLSKFWEPETRAHHDALRERLNALEVSYREDDRLVRGLDYYTKTVFEVHSGELGSQNALCGGGRYDNLVKECGGPPTPAVGVAMGVERALIVLKALGKLPTITTAPDVFAICLTENRSGFSTIVSKLRAAKISVLTDLEFRSAKSQFRQADKSAATFAVTIGDEELAQNSAKVKTMATGVETLMPLSELSTALNVLIKPS